MTILTAALNRLQETAADAWWDKQTPEFKKKYIQDHPNSKYAKGDGGKPARTPARTAAPKSWSAVKQLKARKEEREAARKKAAADARAAAKKNPKAAVEKAHGEYVKATDELKALTKKHAPEFKRYNDLLKAYHGASGKKQEAIDKQLSDLDKLPHIKKALKLTEQKQAAKVALAEAKKSAPVEKPAAKKAKAFDPTAHGDEAWPATEVKSTAQQLERSATWRPRFNDARRAVAELIRNGKELTPDAVRQALKAAGHSFEMNKSGSSGNAAVHVALQETLLPGYSATPNATKSVPAKPPAKLPDTFSEAKKVADALWKESEDASKALNAFTSKHPKGPMGLTPDNVRALPEFKKLKQAYDQAHKRLGEYNQQYMKKYAKDVRREREARLAAKQRTFDTPTKPRKSRVGM